MPLDSASVCFWKLLPTPDSLTVVRLREPNTLENTANVDRQQELKLKHSILRMMDNMSSMAGDELVLKTINTILERNI